MYDIIFVQMYKENIMPKLDLPPLSLAETEILRLLWQLGNATVQNICDHLPPKRNITYATVQTLMRRLEKKGYIKHRNRGKAHLFYPAAKKEDVINKTVTDFLNRLFDGDPVPLIQYLARHSTITAGDIERLKKLTTKNKK